MLYVIRNNLVYFRQFWYVEPRKVWHPWRGVGRLAQRWAVSLTQSPAKGVCKKLFDRKQKRAGADLAGILTKEFYLTKLSSTYLRSP
jgi:hypothetical protein